MLGKKGELSNIVIMVVLIFFLAVSLVVVIFVNDIIADVIKTTALNDTSVAADITSKMDIINSSTVDNSFAFIIGALIIGMMISAFMARTNAAWFFVYMIVTAVIIFAAAPLANMYATLLEAPAIAASIASDQTSINYIMENLVVIMIISAALSAFIALSKPETLFGGGTADI